MIDETDPRSVEAIAKLARQGVQTHKLEDGREIALVPDGFQQILLSGRADLPKPPTRIRALRTFHEVESFGRYCARYKEATPLLLADIDRNKVICVLDYHRDNDAELEARAGDHIAVLELPYSDEFQAWNEMEGKDLNPQADFIEFLTQHSMDLVTPAQADMLELVQDFSVSSNTEFVSRKTLKSGEVELHYESKDTPKGKIVVPDKMTVSLPIFRGEEPQKLEAWFRYRVNGGALLMGFLWHRFFEVKQASFKQAVTRAADEAGIAPYYGECDARIGG